MGLEGVSRLREDMTRQGSAEQDSTDVGMEFRLVCPTHRVPLEGDGQGGRGRSVPWPDEQLKCRNGCRFAVERGIPRFVERGNYAKAFGLQWRRYQRTQLDSYTGYPISRVRLERCLGAPLASLREKTVLEVGSGAGRFTELLIENCGFLVSIDLSDAVDANLANCGEKEPYLLLQADVNQSPLPHRNFDVVFCLGVIQHTRSPEATIRALADHVRPGGLLVIDHYARATGVKALSRFLTLAYPLRAVLKRLRPELGLKATDLVTAICDPVRKQTCKIPWLDRIACRIFPSFCYYTSYPELGPDRIYEWNALDTHDALTDHYKHLRTVREIQDTLQNIGLSDIVCAEGGNGIEARARLHGIDTARLGGSGAGTEA